MTRGFDVSIGEGRLCEFLSVEGGGGVTMAIGDRCAEIGRAKDVRLRASNDTVLPTVKRC